MTASLDESAAAPWWAAPRISPSQLANLGIMVVSLYSLYLSTSQRYEITTAGQFITDDCALINDRTIRTQQYYNDGTVIYHRFAVGWRKHGFPDIADDWEALASRDRDRAIAMQAGPYVTHCASAVPTPHNSPAPILFPALSSAPPNH